MLNFIFILFLLVVAVCLVVAYAYLIVINRENEMPDFEDVEIGQDENRGG
ncbi:MAG: hypothetical protein WBN03_18030 [Desulfobacterales bacterium]